MRVHAREQAVEDLDRACPTAGPLLSITHSARAAMAASVISPRDGTPSLTRFSSTCVAQIAGTSAASQIQRISSCISASRSKPISAARSPRAIITPNGRRPLAQAIRSGRFVSASGRSILATRPSGRSRAPRGRQRRLEKVDILGAADEGIADHVGTLDHGGEVAFVLRGERRQAERRIGQVDALLRFQLDAAGPGPLDTNNCLAIRDALDDSVELAVIITQPVARQEARDHLGEGDGSAKGDLHGPPRRAGGDEAECVARLEFRFFVRKENRLRADFWAGYVHEHG